MAQLTNHIWSSDIAVTFFLLRQKRLTKDQGDLFKSYALLQNTLLTVVTFTFFFSLHTAYFLLFKHLLQFLIITNYGTDPLLRGIWKN